MAGEIQHSVRTVAYEVRVLFSEKFVALSKMNILNHPLNICHIPNSVTYSQSSTHTFYNGSSLAVRGVAEATPSGNGNCSIEFVSSLRGMIAIRLIRNVI